MKKILSALSLLILAIAVKAQTMNVVIGDVTYQFPATQAGNMAYEANIATGNVLTIMGKSFATTDITRIYIDNTEVMGNLVTVTYEGTSAKVTVAGNVAQYVTPTVNDAHVSIEQSNTDDVNNDEIVYSLSGTTTDGEFAMSGSYKCTIQLAGLTLTNPSGAAIQIANGKRIQISAKNGTVNTLTDGANGSQKACIYSKGQIQLQGQGTLNVTGKTAHAIKSGDYISVKNLTLNVLSAVKDGISCNEYFQMKSGNVNISNVSDDGIQADLDGTTTTGETTDHEDEDSGNIYLEGGTLNITTTATSTKCVKAAGDMKISGGTITLKSTGAGGKCIKADGKLIVSDGVITATSTGSNYKYSSYDTSAAKAIKCDGALTINGGTITAIASSHEAIESKSTIDITGGTVYAQSSDDAINSASTFTISGGSVCGYSTGNDGLDANGNMYIKGGLIYAIGKTSPEMALDANTEGGYKLYVQGGTIIAIGSLEGGASLTQSCYQSSSWNKNTWYSITVGSDTFAFMTPSSGGTSLVVSGASQPSVKSGVTVTGGTSCFNGMGNTGGTISGGSTVTLSTYSGGNSGPGGGGGGHRPW